MMAGKRHDVAKGELERCKRLWFTQCCSAFVRSHRILRDEAQIQHQRSPWWDEEQGMIMPSRHRSSVEDKLNCKVFRNFFVPVFAQQPSLIWQVKRTFLHPLTRSLRPGSPLPRKYKPKSKPLKHRMPEDEVGLDPGGEEHRPSRRQRLEDDSLVEAHEDAGDILASPSQVRIPWTQEEELWLIERKMENKTWIQMCQLWPSTFAKRNNLQLKDKWRNLEMKHGDPFSLLGQVS